MHTAKYTKVEPSYKNYHTDIYFKTKERGSRWRYWKIISLQ